MTDRLLRERPDDIGLEFAGRQWSFGQLDERSSRLAGYLASLGFRAGDRLAVYLTNSVVVIDALLAAGKLGLVFTPINVLYRERETGHILADAEPRA